MIFVDSSIFYNFLFETELTGKATKIFESELQLFTSFTAVNETVYVISRKMAEKKHNIRSYRKFREYISQNGYESFEELTKFFDLLDDFDITVLRDYQDIAEVWRIMRECKLLPNDALIATCRHYGIKKIATFDEDFKRVDFLEVVEVK